jgi:phosphate transport system permease protein
MIKDTHSISNRRRPPQWMARFRLLLHYGDRPWNVITISMAVLTILLVLAIGILLWRDSAGSRAAFGLNFLKPTSDASWNPVSGQFQAWPFIYGTLITSLFSLMLAVPISLGVAIFLAELSPEWLRAPLGGIFELLAAIPSVIYGLWGIFVFLPNFVEPVGKFLGATLGAVPVLNIFFRGPIPASGSSMLAAAFILSIMITPTITAITRDVFLAIPVSQREASLALGSTRWEMIWKVLIPYGLSGILGASILGLGRALGETMAVTMVVGNSIGGSLSLLKPGYTMSSIIANEFAEAVSPLHTQALLEVGLILFVMTLLLNILARLLVWRVGKGNVQGARA